MNKPIMPEIGVAGYPRKGEVQIHPLDAATLNVFSTELPRSAGANPAVLCLDFGQRMGWALRDGDGNVMSGVAELRTDRWQGGGIRFLKLRRWLADVKEAAGGIDLVLYEQMGAHTALNLLSALVSLLRVVDAQPTLSTGDRRPSAGRAAPLGTGGRTSAATRTWPAT